MKREFHNHSVSTSPPPETCVFYFYGEDKFRILREIEKLKSLFLNKDQLDFNFDNLVNPSAGDFLSIANSYPVFSDKRMIKVEDFDNSFLLDDQVVNYFNSPLSSTITVIYDKSSKVNENSKLLKELKAKRHFKIVKFRSLYDNELPSYIKSECKEKKIPLSMESIFYLMRYTGNNTYNIDNELNKLASLGLSEGRAGDISPEELKPVLSFSKKFTVFDLVDKIIDKDLRAAFPMFGILYEDGEEPVKIISILYNEIRKIHKGKLLELNGADTAFILGANSVPPFLKSKFLNNMSRFTSGELKKILELLEETDLRLKTSGFPRELIFEEFIFKLKPVFNLKAVSYN